MNRAVVFIGFITSIAFVLLVASMAFHHFDNGICMPTWSELVGNFSEYWTVDNLSVLRGVIADNKKWLEMNSNPWNDIYSGVNDFWDWIEAFNKAMWALSDILTKFFSMIFSYLGMFVSYVMMPFEMFFRFITSYNLFSCPVDEEAVESISSVLTAV